VIILVLSYVSSIPQGFSGPAIDGMIRLAPPLLLAIALAAVAFLAARRWGFPGSGALFSALLFAALIALPHARLRAELRYPIYESHNSTQPAYQIHMLERTYVSSWTIWRYLDDGAPHRIALAAGWDGMGHNWYRYPLVGSRLQNEVIYVPFTDDGSVVDYRLRDAAYVRADFNAWLKRLIERRIEFVVILHPSPIEQQWMEQNPELFERAATSTDGYNVVYRCRLERAAGGELNAHSAPTGPAEPHTLR
jgi:hypothetical protein